MPIGLAKGTRDILTTTKDALDSDEPLREEHRGTGKSNPPGFTLKKNRGRPRTIHLADEAAKVALMKQWANLRMSQGTLLSSTTGVSGLSDTTHSQELPSGGRPEVEIPPCEVVKLDKPPDFIPASDHIEPTCLWPSISSPDLVAEPLLEATVTNESIFTPALGFTTKDTSSERFPFSDDLQYPTSSPEIGQRVIEDFAPSQHANTGTVALPRSIIDGSPEIANQPLQLLATDSEVMSLLPVTSVMSELDVTLKSAEAEVPQTRDSPSAGDIQLLVSDVDDSILDFHMVDLPEVLSPWVPVSPTAPSIYVPPAVHHLLAGTRSSFISLTELTVFFCELGMKYQLEIQCQARKRAEELYLEEMRKRIGMEEIVDKLQKEKISTREQDASPTARPFGAYMRSSWAAGWRS